MAHNTLIQQQQTRLAMHGCIILLLGLLSGIGFSYAAAVGSNTSELYGSWKFAHMEGLTNGMLVIAIAGIWQRLTEHSTLSMKVARCLLIFGCYCNIIGPLITALFIGHRVIEPTTALEAFVVYGFYTPGTVPLISFFIFVAKLYKSSIVISQ